MYTISDLHIVCILYILYITHYNICFKLMYLQFSSNTRQRPTLFIKPCYILNRRNNNIYSNTIKLIIKMQIAL